MARRRRAAEGADPSAHGLEHRGCPAGTVLFDGLDDERFYFVHSYGVRDFPLSADGPPSPLAKPMVTWAEHGDRFVAGVENGPLSATQFHPEKSGDAGAHLLTNWLDTLA